MANFRFAEMYWNVSGEDIGGSLGNSTLGPMAQGTVRQWRTRLVDARGVI